MATKIAEPPIIETPDPPPPPPSGIDPLQVFKQARADQGLDQPPAPPVVEDAIPPVIDEPPPAAPAKKGAVVPEDVIDPDKAPSPKVHDDVAELLTAELPKGAKKEQIESFGKLKGNFAEKLQAALDKAAELEKKIQSGATPAAELEELRKGKEAAEERARAIEQDFEKVAFEQSPKFRSQFVEQEKTAIDLAKSYLDGTEIKPDIVDLAAHATGRKRLEILKDAGIEDTTVISSIQAHLADYDRIQRQKQTVLSNWKAEASKWNEEQSQIAKVQKERRVSEENKVWETIVPKLDLLPLRKSKDNSEWNSRADALLEEAKRRFNGDGTDLPIFAETIAKGVAYDAQQEVVDHLKGEVANLRAENAKLKSAAPGGSINAGTNDGAPPPPPAPGDKAARERQQMDTFNAEKAKAQAA